ncbi:unnamed protein product [Ilex paraguariensis]|uniref:RRM domain-containing protein n=1 Tax=Ilex paraguariensis TaxID=185542 RepID=A0ABC8TH70_9AQUA
MAVVESASSHESNVHCNDQDQPKNNNHPHNHVRTTPMVDHPSFNHDNSNSIPNFQPHLHNLHVKVHPFHVPPPKAHVSTNHNAQLHDGLEYDHVQKKIACAPVSTDHRSNGGNFQSTGDVGESSFKREMRELEEMFSKLNPMAAEFVPPSLANSGINDGYFMNNSAMPFITTNGNANGYTARWRRNNYSPGKRGMNNRTSMAQREDVIRRTVYVSDIDHQITEEQLAALFLSCGQVIDCRVCGDPNSVLRFAFVEFTDEEGAQAALSLAGTMLGYYPVRVLPSKTAIAPVNPTFLPRSEDEREMCARTIYCTNIDKKVLQADVKLFFESVCGEVYRLRLLGDYHHSTRIAFVEFVMMDFHLQ